MLKNHLALVRSVMKLVAPYGFVKSYEAVQSLYDKDIITMFNAIGCINHLNALAQNQDSNARPYHLK